MILLNISISVLPDPVRLWRRTIEKAIEDTKAQWAKMEKLVQ